MSIVQVSTCYVLLFSFLVNIRFLL